jgi:hypothetical protein
MNTIKLTPQNVRDFIGYKVILILGEKYIIKELLNVDKSGNIIHLEYSECKNSLNIVSNEVYVMI